MKTKDLLITIGKNVTAFRAIRGISQKELATKAEISNQTLSTIERGIQNSSVGTLNEICTALNVPFKSLFRSESEWSQILEKLESYMIDNQ